MEASRVKGAEALVSSHQRIRWTWAGLAEPADDARLAEVAQRLTPDDPINIQFTSGATGLPKARR